MTRALQDLAFSEYLLLKGLRLVMWSLPGSLFHDTDQLREMLKPQSHRMAVKIRYSAVESKIYFSMGLQSIKLCFPRLNAADMRQRYVRPRLSAADIRLSAVELGLSGV